MAATPQEKADAAVEKAEGAVEKAEAAVAQWTGLFLENKSDPYLQGELSFARKELAKRHDELAALRQGAVGSSSKEVCSSFVSFFSSSVFLLGNCCLCVSP